jgi:predicted Zn finger-like uncharacterized protein
MQITCPGCGAKVAVQSGETAPDGRVRVQCPGCEARLLIKINRPDLKIDDRIPTTDGNGEAALPLDRSSGLGSLERFSIDVGSGEFSSSGAGLRVVVVQTLPEAGLSELRRGLIRIPRFSRNPNKVHDATAELPFILTGLEQEEADALEALVIEQGGSCVAGPEWRVLDEVGRPRGLDQIAEPVVAEEIFGEADEGLLIMGEADDEDELLVAGEDEEDELLVAGEDEEDELLVAGGHDEDEPEPPEQDSPPAVPRESRAPTGAPPPSRKQPDWLAALARPVLAARRSRRATASASGMPGDDPIELAPNEDSDDQPIELAPDEDGDDQPIELAPDEDGDVEPIEVAPDEDGDVEPIEVAPDEDGDVEQPDEPIELAPDEDGDVETPGEADPSPEAFDPLDLAPETYEDFVAVVTSDHMPSVEIPIAEVRLVTVETMPEQGEAIGIVSATIEVPPSAAAGSKADAVAGAIQDAEEKLQIEARARGASMIVAVRTTASDLVDGTLIVVMQGTATR